nr:hypothetical protein [Tanacetum cinerariifolium]
MVEAVKKGPSLKGDQESIPESEPGPVNKTHKMFFDISDAAQVAAFILFSFNKQLSEIDLSDFISGRPEAEALEVMTLFSEPLKHSDLRYLNLSNNALGEKGVRAFGQLLASQGKLEELYLMNDGISEEAAKAF